EQKIIAVPCDKTEIRPPAARREVEPGGPLGIPEARRAVRTRKAHHLAELPVETSEVARVNQDQLELRLAPQVGERSRVAQAPGEHHAFAESRRPVAAVAVQDAAPVERRAKHGPW